MLLIFTYEYSTYIFYLKIYDMLGNENKNPYWIKGDDTKYLFGRNCLQKHFLRVDQFRRLIVYALCERIEEKNIFLIE